MSQEQISPETRIQLENFLKEVEDMDSSDSYPEETFEIKPSLIFEFLEENDYEVESDDFDEHLVSYIFSKNNEDFDEYDDESMEMLKIKLTINIMDFSCDITVAEY